MRRFAGGLLAILPFLVALPGIAEVEPLTLFQKAARAPLVLRARSLSDSTRRPQVEVLHIFKGSCPARVINIVPHFEDNGSPTPWLKREVFLRGEESMLFLTPYVRDDGKEEGPDIFSVLGADQGKLSIPAEGAGALEDALTRFVSILSLGQHDRQGTALRALLREKNPYLIEAGLEECGKFRLGLKEDIESILHLTGDRRPDFRAGALTLLAQIVEDSNASSVPTSSLDATAAASLMDHVAAAALLDAEESVRRRAVGVLEAIGGQAALALLETIGKADPSQSVRYEAQVAAYRMRQVKR
ncbi:MAG TPA: hypothetical protein VGK94_08120 [Candidatus Polarisedimenticolia bacterium]